MDIIFIVRLVIFLTFLLLLAEGVAAIIFVPRFVGRYERRHLELQMQVRANETEMQALKERIATLEKRP